MNTHDIRRAAVAEAIRTFPDSVLGAVYPQGAPPALAPLRTLLEDKQPGPVLARFFTRLQDTRPDLSEAELLALLVPVHAGDQEVFLARLGKWRFELRQLERGA